LRYDGQAVWQSIALPYDLKNHLVWITKYRKPVLGKGVGTRAKDLIRMICASLDVEVVKGNISRDHVHLPVRVPPTLAVARPVQRLEGLTSRKLLQQNRRLNKAFWGRHPWGRGYYVASAGNVTGEMIAHYIENQQDPERDQDADFERRAVTSASRVCYGPLIGECCGDGTLGDIGVENLYMSES
jgi:putative transposase